jgi:hypothetical protein
VKIIDSQVNFVAMFSNKLQNLNLEGKINGAFNVFTLGPITQAILIRIIQIIRGTMEDMVESPILISISCFKMWKKIEESQWKKRMGNANLA